MEVHEYVDNGESLFIGKINKVLKRKGAGGSAIRSPRTKYIGSYLFETTIADGLYGKVKSAVHVLTQEKVVIKIIEKKKIDVEKYREIDIMKLLSHKHIVKMLEVIETDEKNYIVYEFVRGGELYDHMVSKGHLTEDEAREFWRQMVCAVEYMHSKGIVHRDLKLENMMLDENGDLVIIDLGLGNFMSPESLLKTYCGSAAYAAPEMFLCENYLGGPVDVWSLGVIIYCLVLGFLPFEDPQRVVEADFVPLNDPLDDDCFVPVSHDFEDLIRQIFQKDPSKRLTIEEIKRHPWTTKRSTHSRTPSLSSDDNKEQCLFVEKEDGEFLSKLEEFGFDKESIHQSIHNQEFNAITATLFLLKRKKERERAASTKARLQKEDERKRLRESDEVEKVLGKRAKEEFKEVIVY